MDTFYSALSKAFELIVMFDPDIIEIIILSLKVSLSAVLLAIFIGMPIGAYLAIAKFPFRKFFIILFNVMMGLPPVVVGLILYLILSMSGPLGFLELLYTPSAMIIAQFILVVPIIISLTRQVIEDLNIEYKELLDSLGLSMFEKLKTLIWDARYSLSTGFLAGIGRALSEVGAVLIVGGNINHVTRVMTTTIALETSKGDIIMAISLGIILLTIALILNLSLYFLKSIGESKLYV